MPDSNSPAENGGNKTSFGVDVPANVKIGGAMPPAVSQSAASQPGHTKRGSNVKSGPATAQPYYTDPTAVGRAAQREKNGRGADTAWDAQATAASDMLGQFVGYVTGSYNSNRLAIGIIKDGTAIANVYWVSLADNQNPVMATAITHSSAAAMGATEINTYVPGTRVVIIRQERERQGFILGALPNFLYRGKDAFQDTVSQASRNRVDEVHKKHVKQTKSSEMPDYSNWRPYDATLAGEWGTLSSTGIRITVDDFMLQAAVNEFCGLYGFYHDNLLRVAGYNMQVWTAGSERDAYMDQAECNDSQGYTPYPWEGMGVLNPGTPVINQYDPGCYQCFEQKPYYSRWENRHEFAQPYHRSQMFFGYLGQGMRQLVHSPPQQQYWTYKGEVGPVGETPYDSKIEPRRGKNNSASITDFYKCKDGPAKLTDHTENPVYGLSEENKALDGRLFLASAKGVHISKRILLPFPQRIKRPEDINHGDEATKNYKAASLFGSGEEHPITGVVKPTDNEYPNLQRATALLDLHGYLYNYSGLHAFYWHAKDYKTWEQQELPYASVNQKIPPFPMLGGSQMYLREEPPKIFKIDHRYDKNPQKFYETESFVSLLEDGGVVIGDGYGAEIRMTGGCVFISAPGDVWLKSGRDVQAWAGNDVVARANKTVDISANEKNVRIKAERNVLVLAGNDSTDREGGILLESRSKTTAYDFEKCGDDILFGGVVVRTPKSNFVALSKDIYLRTGGGDVEKGDITLDASQGAKDIITTSNDFHTFLDRNGRVYQYFEISTGVVKANMFSRTLNVMGAKTSIGGDAYVFGKYLGSDAILITKGTVVTPRGGMMAPCDSDCVSDVNKALNEFKDFTDKKIPEAGRKIDEYVDTTWLEEKRAGNSRVMSIMEFSFRKDEDYRLPAFLLYEDRWQQMARLGSAIPNTWNERPVKVKVCDKTYAYPGRKWLEEEPALREQDFNIVQVSGGYIDKERNEAPGLDGVYKEPEFKKPADKIINTNYIITPRN